MKKVAFTAALVLAAGVVRAGGVDIKINKHSITVSPIDAQGFVVVQGMPGTVMGGMAPVRVIAESKKTKQSTAGVVNPDGSFALQVPSMLKDSIKLIVMGADGKKKDHKVKVEAMGGMLAPAPASRVETVTEQVTLPAGAPVDAEPQLVPADAAPPPPPPAAPPSDAEIVKGEQALDAAGVVE